MAVAGELNAVSEPVPQVVHEGDGVVAVPAADQPRNQQLGFGLDRGPGPGIARASNRGLHFGDVLLLRCRERPDFIHLYPPGLYAPDLFVMEGRTRLSSVHQQLADRINDTSATREIDRMDDPSQSMREDLNARFEG